MPFSAYDPEAVRLLSASLRDALEMVGKCSPGALSETETANLSQGIAANLMRAFDHGERDPSALTRAGLDGISAPPPRR